MKPEELEPFLRQYTDKELYFLSGNQNDKDLVFEKYEITGQDNGTSFKTYIFEDDYFLSSYENIGINKQDRFTSIVPHRHNYIEIIYVWYGACTQIINGKKLKFVRGDLCILDTNTIHSVEETGENDIIVNILIRKEFFAAAFFNRMTKQGILAEFLINAMTKGQETKQYLMFKTQSNDKFCGLMKDILCEYYSNGFGKREVMESYIIILFAELLRTYRETPAHNEEPLKSDHKLFDILEYIENHYENCTLSSVAQYFGFNEKYLTMLLKRRTGRSFVEHLQEQKLNRAKLLLMNTNLPITEIITLCGYNNTNFFYKKFRNSENCTPAEYRERMFISR
ncbi:helix-turn-helix domain-containing protein [Anaerocolumna sedimenticola]|uniref:Helix-turn-helix domain-containing protein n=1 Tax=Anaerocolumna sedimenticola TaxID=2696063 RepID=A0A6P1TGR1_9FIRM|nr:AraC family transcriptional regulator [Anaerocolumna sedimenticola]QHQ60334.1 helix-turn-helix domain-containing protein [Anaerocolumna sedimenticola]